MSGTVTTRDVIEMARDALAPQLEAIAAKEAGVRSGADEEELHDMRVASRRARAVLASFGPVFRRGPLRRRKEEMKALTSALGTAREWDVHASALSKERRSAATDTERLALDYAIARVGERRAAE